MMKAYSYIRFSTPEQLKGDSFRRQLEASEKYAKEHRLTLDTSLNLRDLGLSAYHGTHKTKGALGVFLKLVETGKIERGSVLIVENLDRLSRQQPLKAFNQFSSIVQAGIKLVTLTDRQEYTEESINKNPGQLWISLGTMMRAYQESERKSDLLKSAWETKRKNGQILTGKCPAWLTLSEDRSHFIVKKEVVKAIKRIFKMKLDGLGEERIAIELNNSGLWQPPKNKRNKHGAGELVQGGWRKSYVAKILRNRSVLGEFTPHRLVYVDRDEDRRVKTNEGKKRLVKYISREKAFDDPILDYYPAIIDLKTFNRTQYLIQETLKQKGFLGGKTGKATNLFAHLVRCGLCGGPMHYIDKGKPPKGGQYLHCDNSRRNLGCSEKPIRYDEFQDIIFNNLWELDISKLNPDQEEFEKEIDSIQASIEDYKQRLSDVNKKINNLVDLGETSGDPDIMARLWKRKKEKLEIEQHIKDLEQQRSVKLENSQNQREKVDTVKEVKQLLEKAKGEDQRINLRLRLRAELRRLIDYLKVYPLQQEYVPAQNDYPQPS